MKTVKTSKGTELPIMDLRGKAYLQVAYRILWAREEHPDWSFTTDLIASGQDSALFKATISDASGKVLSTAHKREDKAGFADFLEKAETGAIGRALALAGYGTQFTDDLDEGGRIADSPLPAPSPKAPSKAALKAAPPVVKPFDAPRARDELNRDLMGLYKTYMTRFPNTVFREMLLRLYRVDETRLMTSEQIENLIFRMKEDLNFEGDKS